MTNLDSSSSPTQVFTGTNTYLNNAVMKEIPDPGNSGVSMLVIKIGNLLLDYFFCSGAAL